MGLDMYIHRRIRGYRKDDGTLSHSFSDYKEDEYGCSNSETVETQAAYWRKSNQIHKWFVDHAQDGNDDCGEYDIGIDTIKELRDECMKVLKKMKGMVLRVPKKDVEEFEKYFGDKGIKQRITIDPDNLSELLTATGYHVVADPSVCKDILPTQGGFFFGCTEYNGYYFYDIVNTIRMLDRIMEQDKEYRKNGIYPDYTYHASW